MKTKLTILLVGIFCSITSAGFADVFYDASRVSGGCLAEFQNRALMTVPRSHATATVEQDKAYVFGGQRPSESTPVNTVEMYDPVADVWSQKAPMPTARSSSVAESVNGKIYIIGGSVGGGSWSSYNVNELYDPDTDSWTAKTSMPTGRHQAVSMVYNEKIYVIGGEAGIYEPTNSVEIYDPETDTWSTGASMPTARGSSAIGEYNDEWYVISGYLTYANFTKAVEKYNPKTNTWTTLSPTPYGLRNAKTVVSDGKIYCIGGRAYDTDWFWPDVLVYDIANDTWDNCTNESFIKREGFASVTVNNYFIAFGGKTPEEDIAATQACFVAPANRKAIIVAGGGDYETNTLWDATMKCASYAYTALNTQGYTKNDINYFSADLDLDLDNDGISEVAGDATGANLEYAVKTWARDTDNLFIYLVGHGGDGAFRIGETEILLASDFDRWLDDVQKVIPGFVAVVYDACYSGSFLAALKPEPGKQRIVATSAASDEVAVFQADGGLSFGYQFFSYLFGGGSFYESFVHGKKSIEGTLAGDQEPQIEGNANGVGNEKGDQRIAQSIKVGDEIKTANDIPKIGSVSPGQALSEDETQALIYGENVVDADGIQEVFAVIKPPDYTTGSPDNPVTDLPTVTLTSVGNGRYEGIYDNFISTGTYNIAVFARDAKGTLSLPVQTTVTKGGACFSVNGDLSIRVPCAEYNGAEYGFTLKYYDNRDDPFGYYWKLDGSTLAAGSGIDCLNIGADLSLTLSCAEYAGTQYGFTLVFYKNPKDISGLYWKMDMSTLVVK